MCNVTYNFFLRFFLLPQRNIPGGNGQLWNGYNVTSDEVPQGEQSV